VNGSQRVGKNHSPPALAFEHLRHRNRFDRRQSVTWLNSTVDRWQSSCIDLLFKGLFLAVPAQASRHVRRKVQPWRERVKVNAIN